MLVIPIIEEWDSQMLQIPKLVRMYEKREMRFEEACNQFLVELEQLAERDRLSLAQEIAVIRGGMLKEYRLPGEKGESASIHRKRKEAAHLEGLEKANAQVRAFFENDKNVVAECRNLLRQAIAVMFAKEIVGGVHQKGAEAEEILAKLYQDAELIPIVTMAVGKVGKINTRILVDTLIPEVTGQHMV